MSPDKTLEELQRFKLAVEQASDHIIITDENAVILYANPAAERITGFFLEEMLGKKSGTKDLWGGQMPREFYEKMWRTIKEEKKPFTGEVQNRRKSGEIYTALLSISPVVDGGGQVKYFVGIERDITKEKAVDQAKTEFVSLASHQLRTPLTAINWYIEMLLSGDAGKLTKDQFHYLQEIYKGSRRMVRLVNDLLNISRLEMGGLAIEPVPTDPAKLIRETIEENLQTEKDEVRVKVAFDSTLLRPIKVSLDPDLLSQVLRNLIDNARRYTSPKKNGRVEVKLVKDSEGNFLISVSDNGIGIPQGDQPRLFERFYRASNAEKLATGGTGLGLYISKLIVEFWGGKIWFDSKENEGATFYVTIPSGGMEERTGEKKLT